MPTYVTGADGSALENSRLKQLADQSYQQMMRTGLAAFGTGAAVRGLQGLLSQLSRNTSSASPSVPAPMEIQLPVAAEDEEEQPRARKRAADEGFLSMAGDTVKGLANKGLGLLGSGLNRGREIMAGSEATSPVGLPTHIPGVVASAVGGAGAGYKLVDYILDKRRQQAAEQELDDAKQEYEDALMGKTSQAVDTLYDALEKQSSLGDIPGALTGAYALWAAGAPLAFGKMTYDHDKKFQRRSLINAAQKLRQRLRYQSSPPPVYVTPVPQPQGVEEDEEKMANVGLPKLDKSKLLANLGLLGGGALLGSGYGAISADKGSRLRGGLIGALAGAGGGAGLMGTNAFMDSSHARHLRDTSLGQAPVVLGGTGLGLSAGLRAGRNLADALGIKGHKGDNPNDDLEELDVTKNKSLREAVL